MRLDQFDLNLLIAFDVLIQERGVTRAAERLNLTQSAMSAALKRLREDGRALVDEAAIFRTIEAMRAIADDAVRASKTARRQRERRLRVVPGGRSDLLPVEPDEADTLRQIREELPPHERMFPVEEWE